MYAVYGWAHLVCPSRPLSLDGERGRTGVCGLPTSAYAPDHVGCRTADVNGGGQRRTRSIPMGVHFAWRAFSILILIWIVTALFSVPAHQRLLQNSIKGPLPPRPNQLAAYSTHYGHYRGLHLPISSLVRLSTAADSYEPEVRTKATSATWSTAAHGSSATTTNKNVARLIPCSSGDESRRFYFAAATAFLCSTIGLTTPIMQPAARCMSKGINSG